MNRRVVLCAVPFWRTGIIFTLHDAVRPMRAFGDEVRIAVLLRQCVFGEGIAKRVCRPKAALSACCRTGRAVKTKASIRCYMFLCVGGIVEVW